MKTFRVWIRPADGSCRVRVENALSATWLLDRLSRSFIFKSCEPVREEADSACCNFRVMIGSQTSHPLFTRLLAAIPEVTLALEPVG